MTRTKLHLYDLLWQADTWRDRHGAEHRLDDMGARHRKAALRAIRRLADILWSTHETELLLRNDMTAVADHRHLPAELWIEHTPLVLALARLVARDRIKASSPRRWWR